MRNGIMTAFASCMTQPAFAGKVGRACRMGTWRLRVGLGATTAKVTTRCDKKSHGGSARSFTSQCDPLFSLKSPGADRAVISRERGLGGIDGSRLLRSGRRDNSTEQAVSGGRRGS